MFLKLVMEHRYDHPTCWHPNVMCKNLKCSLNMIQPLNDVDHENTPWIHSGEVSYRDTTSVDGRRKGFIQQFKLVKVLWGADCQASSSGIFCQSGQFPVHKTLILAPNWLMTSYFLVRPLLDISSSCGGPKRDIFKPIISPRIEQIKQLVFLSKMKLQPILSFLTQFSLSALLPNQGELTYWLQVWASEFSL